MITRIERWLFTIVFIALVLLAAYEEYHFSSSKFDLWGFAWLVFSAVALAGPSRAFLKIISKMFLDLGLTTTRLHEFSSERNSLLKNAEGPGRDEYADTAELVTNTLKYAEAWLNGWAKGSHFELSVFLDKEMPLLFAYFDSNKDAVSRSSINRRANPTYYRDEDYEVIRMLDNPTSVPRIVSNTLRSQYRFASANQESQIKSTILLYADVSVPCVLVVTSNKKKAFKKHDRDLMQFISYVAETVYYDVRQRGFVNRIRALKPELFAGA